ncbi:MAG: hypothetical protein ACO3F2_07905 [Roseiflexaceae bacterium]|jgi:hypothetical protein
MNPKQVPLWLVGLLIGVGLIVFASMDQQRGALTTVFEQAPTPELGLLDDLLAPSPTGPTATPHVVGERIAVYIANMERVGSTLEIRGTIENRSQENITLGLQNILFIDAVNINYGVGESAIELVVLQQVPFSFQVPVPPGRPLTMTITLDSDPAVVIPLLQESITP